MKREETGLKVTNSDLLARPGGGESKKQNPVMKGRHCPLTDAGVLLRWCTLQQKAWSGIVTGCFGPNWMWMAPWVGGYQFLLDALRKFRECAEERKDRKGQSEEREGLRVNI